MAGFATRASFAGHPSHSATADHALTFNPDHLSGAGQLANIGVSAMTTERKRLIGIAILIASMIYGSPAFCDFIVVSSPSKALKVCSEIPDAAVVEIGNQEQLRLMDKNSGETRILIGPYKGTVGNYSSSPQKERSKPMGATRGPRKDLVCPLKSGPP